MTTEVEKQFFDTFEIKPKQDCWTCKHFSRTELCKVKKDNSIPCNVVYPQITDRHYLELICLYNRHSNLFISSASEIENLKIHIISSLVSNLERENTDELKHQVQAIFERK